MLKKKTVPIGGKEETVEIAGGRRVTVREPTAEELLRFYQDDEKFLSLSRYVYGDLRDVIEMLDLCTDLPRKEIERLAASDFYKLVSVLREVHADFLPILRAEMKRFSEEGEKASEEKKTPSRT